MCKINYLHFHHNKLVKKKEKGANKIANKYKEIIKNRNQKYD